MSSTVHKHYGLGYPHFSIKHFPYRAFLVQPGDYGNPYSVQIGVGVLRHVVVEDYVDPFYVHASSKEIRCHQDSLAETLERLVFGKSGKNKTVNTR